MSLLLSLLLQLCVCGLSVGQDGQSLFVSKNLLGVRQGVVSGTSLVNLLLRSLRIFYSANGLNLLHDYHSGSIILCFLLQLRVCGLCIGQHGQLIIRHLCLLPVGQGIVGTACIINLLFGSVGVFHVADGVNLLNNFISSGSIDHHDIVNVEVVIGLTFAGVSIGGGIDQYIDGFSIIVGIFKRKGQLYPIAACVFNLLDGRGHNESLVSVIVVFGQAV